MGRVGSYPTFSPLLGDSKGIPKRYISVALVLGSPPAGVTRYPCPVEPGLSSPDARWGISRDYPTRLLVHIVNQERQNVKHLAKNIF